jgi:large subunit ribosomal protein L17
MLAVLNPVTDVPKDRRKKRSLSKKVDMAAKMFDEIAPKYVDRPGGYTRIVRIGLRKGDGAPMVMLELV